MTAAKQYSTTLPVMSTPGNLAFDLPFPLSHDYAARNANTAAPVILQDPMKTNPSICRSDMLDAVNLMELDHSLPSGQDTDDFFQPVGGNLTTLGLPLSSTLDALFLESASSDSSILCQGMTLSRPISVCWAARINCVHVSNGMTPVRCKQCAVFFFFFFWGGLLKLLEKILGGDLPAEMSEWTLNCNKKLVT